MLLGFMRHSELFQYVVFCIRTLQSSFETGNLQCQLTRKGDFTYVRPAHREVHWVCFNLPFLSDQ